MRASEVHTASRTDRVTEIMTWPVATVGTRTSLRDILEELAADEVGALAVLEDHSFVGIVSERDVVRHLADGGNPDNLTAGEIMTTDLVTADVSEPILDAARRMREAQIRHLPVLKDDRLVGFVSIRDLFGVLLDVTG